MKFEKELETLELKKEEIKNIMEYFPSKSRLVTAIALNEDLPFEENIIETLKKHFGPEATSVSKEIKKVQIMSSQADILVSRSFNPSFRLKFIGNGPVETTEEVAVYLEKTGNYKRI